MGNIIFSTDIITVSDAEITPRSQLTGYDDENIMDLWRLKRRFRADDLTQSDTNPLLRIDMSAAKTVPALVIDDVNFDTVCIKGHASDLTTDWTTASFAGSDLTVSQNPITGRYSIFIPLTDFDYRWMAIMTPAAASAVGSYTTKWEVGRVAILDTYTELTANMAYGFYQGADQQYADIAIPHGGRDRIDLSGGLVRWRGKVRWGNRSTANVADLRTINLLGMSDPLVFYLNNGNTSEVYICVKENMLGAAWQAYAVHECADLDLVELV